MSPTSRADESPETEMPTAKQQRSKTQAQYRIGQVLRIARIDDTMVEPDDLGAFRRLVGQRVRVVAATRWLSHMYYYEVEYLDLDDDALETILAEEGALTSREDLGIWYETELAPLAEVDPDDNVVEA